MWLQKSKVSVLHRVGNGCQRLSCFDFDFDKETTDSSSFEQFLNIQQEEEGKKKKKSKKTTQDLPDKWLVLEKKIIRTIFIENFEIYNFGLRYFFHKTYRFREKSKNLQFCPLTPNKFLSTYWIDGDFWHFICNGQPKVSTEIWLCRNFRYQITIFTSKLTELYLIALIDRF